MENNEAYIPKRGEIASVELFGEMQPDGTVKIGTKPNIGDDNRTHVREFPESVNIEGVIYGLEEVRRNEWHGRDKVEKDNPEDPRLTICWGVYV